MFKILIEKILYRPSLSFKDQRIFRIANFMMLLGIVIMLVICVALYYFGATLPLWASIAETIIFIVLFVYHVKGHFIITRNVFFAIAISMQVYGSLYHGENGGFDFLFLATAFAPVLFFDKIQYLSLFVYSISAYVAVKVLYNYVEPVMPFERQITHIMPTCLQVRF